MTMTSSKMTHFQNYSRGTIPKAGKSNEHASSTSKEKLKKKLIDKKWRKMTKICQKLPKFSSNKLLESEV